MEDANVLELQIKTSVLTKLQKLNISNTTTDENKQQRTEPIHLDLQKENDKNEANAVQPAQKLLVQDYIYAAEVQRQKEVVKNVQSRLKQFEDFSKNQEVHRKQQWINKQQQFVNDIQQKEHDIFQALEEYDRTSSNDHAQLALYYKKLELRRQQHEKELKKREKEKQILFDCIDNVKKLQASYRSSYEHILLNLKRCVNSDMLKSKLSEDYKQLNVIQGNFDKIISRCSSGKLTENDVAKAAELVSELQNLEKRISQSVDEVNQTVEKSHVEATKPKVPTATAAPLPPATPAISQTEQPELTNLTKFVSLSNIKMYVKLMDFYEKFTTSLKALETDKTHKKFILDCKKAINIPVNSLSGVNTEHILDKYNKLYRLLKGQDVIISDNRVNASAHPLGVSFCMNLLAKQFVLQSDLIISSNPGSAFCYATVIMSLWNEFPLFGQLVLACFYKNCPHLVPYHIPRQVDETDEMYYTRQGYQYPNGQIEKQDKYLKRMTGLMRLYAAIMVVKPKKGHRNVYNIQYGWKWLASTLKLEPQIDITATLIHAFLETAGFELETCYGRMFQKLLRIVAVSFGPNCKTQCTGGATTRLQLLIDDYSKKRKFESPEGYLSYNYW
ncbi:unnamed protein product [Phyllotreta striolata]|uniref:mRNA export factor GLE1 n=1 Tax=Phyllotreta striolata TaxID=444603 RepID=A0A9N9XRR0_PHYSR|nr:unnamed protein product [Phyllotreta striolata]